MYKVSIIIPTYNRAQYLELTVNSFINQKYDKEFMEIIICDNNSTDTTREVVSEIITKNNSIHIYYLFEAKQGVHYARNRAAKIATGDILYFTDDDMIADKEMLEKLMNIYNKHNNIGAVTGRVIPRWEEKPPEWVKKFLNNQWLSLNDLNTEISITKYDLGVYSCHEAVKREIFMKTGGFHPENTAGEWVGDGETGFNHEIEEKGYYFGYVGSAITEHIIPPTRMTQKYLNKRLYNQGCSDSYTEYRKSREEKIIFRASKCKYIIPLVCRWIKVISQVIRNKTSIRFLISYVYYYKARTDYDIRLTKDEKWRKMVLKKNWLEED